MAMTEPGVQTKRARETTGETPQIKKRCTEMKITSDSVSLQEYVDEGGTIKRSEYIRLLQQSLAELGYDSLACKLAEASGFVCEEPSVSELRHHIIDGSWLSAVQAAEACSALSRDQLNKVKYLLMQEHVLEV
jgi:hypothetical protein